MQKFKFVAVILNYKTWMDTVECVQSLLVQSSANHEIVIVENGSENESYDNLTEKFDEYPNVHIIRSDNNLGFAKGNNLGIRYARKKLHADFVYVANSDTIVTTTDLYRQITTVYEKGIGVISPTVMKADGSYHLPAINCNSIYKEAANALIGILYSYLFNSVKMRRRARKQSEIKTENIASENVDKNWKSYIVHGCAYFLTPDFFQFYDCIYPKTFLYWEEINLLMYIRKAKLKSILAETDVVIHKVNGATGIVFKKKERLQMKMSLVSGLKSVGMFFMTQPMIRRCFGK